MKRATVAILIGACLALAGCETTGGTIGGLFPAPKLLKGEIKNGKYTAQNQSFSVAIPHKEGSEEYRYMQVKEQINEYGAYVSFGPAALDQSIYRVEIGRRMTAGSEDVKFEEATPKIVENYKAQLRSGYGSDLRQVVSRQETINGRKAFYYQLTQVVPAGKLISNAPATLTHEVYVIDFGKGAAIVWVQKPELRVATAIEPRALAESVVIY